MQVSHCKHFVSRLNNIGLVRTQMNDKLVDRIGETLGKTVRDIIDKNVYAQVSWTGSDASLTEIYAAVGKKVKEEKITGKYFHPIAREVCNRLFR